MTHYKAIIIGSGQGGTPLAKKLAREGWKTALIEKGAVGGTCVNVGCTPTKTMIASAKTIFTVANAAKMGVKVDDFTIDMPKVLERKEAVVTSFRGGSRSGLEETENLTLVFGHAKFTGPKTVEARLNDGGTATFSADFIFIDTGASPVVPPVKGLDNIHYFTSATIMECNEVPEHLLIVGGAYIGLEFGQMYRRFGSKVTILEASKKFLPREDKDISDLILKYFGEEQISIITSSKLLSVSKNGKQVRAVVDSDGSTRELTCSHILMAAGRKPNTESINLESAGVEVDEQGYVKVNESLQTTAKDIYAIGDVKGGAEFTHIAYNDHLVLYHNLVNGASMSTANRMIPYTMFTDPQLGRVGLTEEEAKKQGKNIRVASLPMKHVARAIETGDTRGMMKAIVDADSGQVLGAAILGQEGGEVMSVVQMAMVGKIGWKEFRNMIFAHPLYAESLNNLFMQLEKE